MDRITRTMRKAMHRRSKTMAKISILGLYNWDDTIFDGLALPDQLDRDTLVENILNDYAEMEVLYPDSDFMKSAIEQWSNMRLHAWNRMQKVLYEDYEPFINIKRDEIRTITQTRNLESDGTSTNQATAWNSSAFADRERDKSNVKDTGTVTTTDNFHVEGDSAITDAQDVLKKEMNVRIRYDLYHIIESEFKERFLLMLY